MNEIEFYERDIGGIVSHENNPKNLINKHLEITKKCEKNSITTFSIKNQLKSNQIKIIVVDETKKNKNKNKRLKKIKQNMVLQYPKTEVFKKSFCCRGHLNFNTYSILCITKIKPYCDLPLSVGICGIINFGFIGNDVVIGLRDVLSKKIFDINTKDKVSGDTVLHRLFRHYDLVQSKYSRLLKLVMIRNPNPYIKNNQGETAIDVLLSNNTKQQIPDLIFDLIPKIKSLKSLTIDFIDEYKIDHKGLPKILWYKTTELKKFNEFHNFIQQKKK